MEQFQLNFTPVIHGDFYRAQVCSNYNSRDFVVVKERLSRQGIEFRTSEEVGDLRMNGLKHSSFHFYVKK